MDRATAARGCPVGVGAVALCLLTIAAARVVPVNAVDGAVHGWLLHHRQPWLTQLALSVTSTGTSTVVVLLVALGTLLLMPGPWSRRVGFAVLLPAVFMVGVGVRLWFSDVVARPRPPMADWAGYASGYAFPSGHTTASALGAGLLLWVVTRTARPWVRVLGGLAVAWAVCVGLTRMYLGVHWPSDVVGAWLFAFACVAAFAAATRGRWPRDDSDVGARDTPTQGAFSDSPGVGESGR